MEFTYQIMNVESIKESAPCTPYRKISCATLLWHLKINIKKKKHYIIEQLHPKNIGTHHQETPPKT